MSTLKANALLDTSGNVLSRVLQVKYTHTTAVGSFDSDDIITQLNTNITPSATSSSILVMVSLGFISTNNCADVGLIIQRDSTALQVGSGADTHDLTFGGFMNMGSADAIPATCTMIDDDISTTSQVTYKVAVKTNSSRQLVLNKRNADNFMRTQSRMILMELPQVN